MQGHPDLPQLAVAVVVGQQIEGDPGLTGHGLFQVLIHIVPVLVVVLQKVLEVGLIVNDHAVNVQGGQHGRHGVQSGVGGVDVQFQPVHML